MFSDMVGDNMACRLSKTALLFSDGRSAPIYHPALAACFGPPFNIYLPYSCRTSYFLLSALNMTTTRAEGRVPSITSSCSHLCVCFATSFPMAIGARHCS